MSRVLIAVFCIVGGVMVGGVATLYTGYSSGDLKLSSALPQGVTNTEQYRTSFLESSKRSCVQGASMRSPTASAQKIEAYCNCFSEGAVDLITDDDLRYMIDHLGSLPPDLTPRLKPLADRCLRNVGAG
jgi:hypothetical protein